MRNTLKSACLFLIVLISANAFAAMSVKEMFSSDSKEKWRSLNEEERITLLVDSQRLTNYDKLSEDLLKIRAKNLDECISKEISQAQYKNLDVMIINTHCSLKLGYVFTPPQKIEFDKNNASKTIELKKEWINMDKQERQGQVKLLLESFGTKKEVLENSGYITKIDECALDSLNQTKNDSCVPSDDCNPLNHIIKCSLKIKS